MHDEEYLAIPGTQSNNYNLHYFIITFGNNHRSRNEFFVEGFSGISKVLCGVSFYSSTPILTNLILRGIAHPAPSLVPTPMYVILSLDNLIFK